MDWLAQWWVVGAGLLVVIAPGAVAALVVGLRGFTAWAAAAPLSLAAIGAASLVNAVIPFRWGIAAWLVTAALLVVAAAGVALVQRRLGGRPWRERAEPGSWSTWLPFAAVAIAAAVITPRELAIFGDPHDISQTFDNVYHLNAVRHILDVGTIAPTEQLIPGFYPSLWHAVVASVVAVSGTSIPVAVNVVSLLLAAVIWPASVVYLVRQIVGPSTPTILVAGVLAAGSWTFPYLLLDYGVLYPNALSIALLPAVLGALVSVAGLGRGHRPPALTRWILLLGWTPTLALAHPSSLMAFFVIGAWPAGVAFARWYRRASHALSRPRRLVGLALWIGGAVLVLAVLLLARPTPGEAFWRPWQTLGHALVETVANAPLGQPWAVVVSALMVTGIAVILFWRRRYWWLVAGWATIGFIYVVCAAFPFGIFRYGITGTWYSDVFRIAALFPVVVVPLAALGFGALVDAVARVALRGRPGGRSWHLLFGTFGAAGVLVVTQLNPALAAQVASGRYLYSISSDSPLLTTSERVLIERLPEHVPGDDVIVGSPWTGTSLSYALADRKALVPHIYQKLTPDMREIVERLDRAGDDPAVCDALRRTGTRWVLDFGAREIHGGDHAYPGLQGLVEAGVATLVDHEGADARLYRIIACG